jgi:hypothetical protein
MTKRKTQCQHETAAWHHPAVRHAKCQACGETLSLGPANDALLAVEHEIAAAAIAAELLADGFARMTNAEDAGFDGDEASPFVDLAAWHGGWLAAEIANDHSDGWDWDISRPVAEQLAETAENDAAAEALLAQMANQPCCGQEPTQVAAQEMFGDGIVVDLDQTDISAAAYEAQRAAEPDIRDEDDHETTCAVTRSADHGTPHDSRFDPEVES